MHEARYEEKASSSLLGICLIMFALVIMITGGVYAYHVHAATKAHAAVISDTDKATLHDINIKLLNIQREANPIILQKQALIKQIETENPGYRYQEDELMTPTLVALPKTLKK